MTPLAWLTIAVTLAVLLCLVRNLAPPDVLFVLAATVLVVCGVISPEQAFSGFANPGMLTVAALFVVAAALRETGVLDYVGRWMLGTARSDRGVTARLAMVVLPMSAFMNNTPIVAMFISPVLDWCRKHGVSASRLLIPLSYLTILGGTCTLIGTSTNLVVDGLLAQTHRQVSNEPLLHGQPVSDEFVAGVSQMGLFEIAMVGLPYAVVGIIYLLLFSRKLLPERKELIEQLGDTQREYLVEMLVEPRCRLVGQSLQKAGMRQLPGLFLIEINRDDRVISPVSPEEQIRAGDRLVFTGVVSSIVDLEKIAGLVPAADPDYQVSPHMQRQRLLCEAVISTSSPLVGKSVRSADFRAQYNAAVVAVHRNGQRVTNKVGGIVLQPGDTLLLQTTSHFVRAHRNNADFYLVSSVHEWRPLRRDRALLALGLFAVLLVMMTTGAVETHVGAALAAALMIVCGCISPGDARESIEWQVLITIAASFAVGAALEESGAAAAVSQVIVENIQTWGPYAALAAIYFVTMLLTEMITNNAAAVLIYPFCLEMARLSDVSPRPFVIALMLAASASFMTPIGYQTNLMVYGPGGYKFTDFVRIGLPLNLLLWGVATVLVPVFWPF